MRYPATGLAAAVMILAGGAVAQAHDADPSRPGSQAHAMGPYQVVDEVAIDGQRETTTGRYTVSPPAAENRRTQIFLALPDCGYEIIAISNGGTIVADGDPVTGTPGPAIRWKDKYSSTEPVTYWYQVRGVYGSEDAQMGIRSGEAYAGIVHRPSCERWTTNGEIPPQQDESCLPQLWVDDSDVVDAMVPPGTPGLRIRSVFDCPGPALSSTQEWQVTADGHVVAVLRSWLESGASEGHLVEHEVHLPIRAYGQVCLHVETSGTADGHVCAPPP